MLMIDTARFYAGKLLRRAVATSKNTRFEKFMYYLTRPIEWTAELVAPTLRFGDDYVVFRASREMKKLDGNDGIQIGIEYVCDVPTGGIEFSRISAAASTSMILAPKKLVNIIGPEGRAAAELWVNERKRMEKLDPETQSKIEAHDA